MSKFRGTYFEHVIPQNYTEQFMNGIISTIKGWFMKYHLMVSFTAITILLAGCNNQKESVSFKPDYLGMTPPNNTPLRFAPDLVSTYHHEHSKMVFTNDGLEMFWAVIPVDTNQRSETGRPFLPGEQNIWHTYKSETGWTTPSILDITKTTSASSPAIANDGKTFYYDALDPNADPDERPRPSFLYGVTKSNGKWANPVIVNNILPNEKGMGSASFCFADNGNLYFDYGGPQENGEWWWSMHFSEFKDGRYQDPVKLEFGINEGEVDWCPWIAPDESYLIWSSHREGQLGNGDLYISFREIDGTWGEPTNMGEKINTPGQERFPSVTPDNKYLFFARHSDSITYSDIYWVEAKIINNLKN